MGSQLGYQEFRLTKMVPGYTLMSKETDNLMQTEMAIEIGNAIIEWLRLHAKVRKIKEVAIEGMDDIDRTKFEMKVRLIIPE